MSPHRRAGARLPLPALVFASALVWIARDTTFVPQGPLSGRAGWTSLLGRRGAASASSSAVEPGVGTEDSDVPASPDRAADSSSLALRPQGSGFKKDQKLRGRVTKILRSGIFVDVGAERDGWVHISKVGHGRVEDIDEAVSKGQELTLWVSKPRPGGGRLELSCRPPVDLSGFRDVPEDQWLSGTVCAIDWSGFYVMVAPPGGGEPQQGKVRRREIRKGWVKNPFGEAEVGDDVRVRVLGVNETSGKLALTMRGM
mmetsp:Transcript_37877/g.113125  ORF Transcript_37877/g.113125 Transcript_37877/m.113125 type:complete len:256 (-) Transcript_37877:74-841(-)